ncbi:hypothetical protein N1030_15050 [Desulfovibrio mangrovi]|uniref:hypothetical protein n=1 Tax=Desulfovibrio mangrovi TaxID=2976983 RepID=UPI0022469C2F|nr:hypothetical protein [Desulfovibrio mangrovi]UZP66910.1 hypothetical protein N1030_15050 [Desulfovibrio mangrovi]
MKKTYVSGRLGLLLAMSLLAFAVLFAGCVARTASWNDQTRTVRLFTPVVVEIPAGFEFAGSLRTRVVGWGDIVTRVPVDTMASEVFTAPAKVMLTQRLIKTDRFYHFRFLGGEKADAWGYTWRTADYVLDTTAPDAEFAQYIAFLNAAGVKLPAKARVHMLDRLSGDFVLMRVVTISYGAAAGDMTGLEPLPPFSKLYDQEKHAEPLNEPRIII